MNMNNEHYVSVLNEHQKKLLETISNCVTVFSGEDFVEKDKVIISLIDELQYFQGLLPPNEYPSWLNILRKKTNSYSSDVNKKSRFGELIISLMDIYKDVKNQEWINEDISFEDIYKQNRAASNINDLFNELIDLLSNMIKNDELQDETVIAGINKLINIINVNKGKSLYSDLSIIDYIFIFFKNIAINTLKEIPAIKIIIESIEKTMEELKKEVNKVQIVSLKEIENNTKISIKLLPENKSLLIESHLGNSVNLLQ